MPDEKTTPHIERDTTTLEALSADHPPLLDTDAALRFCKSVQTGAAAILGADGQLSPRAWILARKSPLTGEPFLDGSYGLVIATPARPADRDLESDLAWLRDVAASTGAVGVAFVTLARAMRLSNPSREDLSARLAEGLMDAPELLYMSLEHRALPHRRHRVAWVRRDDQDGPQLGPWEELSPEDCPLHDQTQEPFPPFLPALH